MRKLFKAFKKFNEDNSGVTLIELIVAVIVLSISIGPLLYTFVYSTRFNAESKTRQRSTSACQTVMENFKSKEMKDICTQFKGEVTYDPSGAAVTTFSNPFLQDNGATYTFTQSASSTEEEVGTYEIIGMTLTDSKYSEIVKYDAVIEVTEGYKTSEMPEVPVFDPRQDALWQETNSNYGSVYYDPYYVATSAVRSAVSDAGYDYNDIIEINISRVIQIIYTNSTVYVQYKYPYDIKLSGDPIPKTGTVVYPALPATDSGSPLSMNLRNIYFYYYPAYAGSHSSSVNVKEDSLILSNTASDKVNLFIYKQLDTVRTSYDLRSCENTYDLCCASQSSAFNTNVYECIQTNLADIGAGSYSSTMSKSIETSPTLYSDGHIILKDTVGPVTSGLLSYNINIKLYKSGDRTEVISEMSGTILK